MISTTNKTYYVDETGDMTFFTKRGGPVIFDGNNKSVSRFFILGVLKIKEDLKPLEDKFEALRKELLQDPFLKRVPSLKKTKVAFHAKDDCAIVRREVFKLLRGLDSSVHAIVLRKEDRLKESIALYQLKNKTTHFCEKEIYADLTKRIFKNLLPKEGKCDIVFSQRGKTFTTASLTEAIERAKINFFNSHHIEIKGDITPIHGTPSHYIGLQIIDYYLWALKKLYEDSESEFFEIVRDKFKFIIDLDDTRNKPYGEYYCQSNKITVERIGEQTSSEWPEASETPPNKVGADVHLLPA